MPTWVWLVAYALATARLAGLIALDSITEPIRDAVERRWPDRWQTVLISCVWCCAIWAAALVAPLAYWHGRNPVVLVPALALAFAQIAGMVSGVGRG